MNLWRLLVDILISIGLSLLSSRINRASIGRLKPVLAEWSAAYNCLLSTTADDAVTLEEAAELGNAVEDAIFATKNLILGK